MNIFYDEKAKQLNVLDERFYELSSDPGKYYPGVTTVLEAYYKGYGFYQWLKDVGYNADEILKKAGELGTNVHNMIDTFLKGNPVKWFSDNEKEMYTLQEWELFCRFQEFYKKYKPEIITNEYKFCNKDLRYGGTIDLICKINGQIWLIDHKTSNALHKTHELQISAYAIAWNLLNPSYKIERCGILWLKSAHRGEDKKGEKIQGKGWILNEFDRSYPESFKLFEHTQAIWEEENQNYKPRNLDFPAEFEFIKF